MKVTVTPSILHGSIEANVSKSYAQRAYAMAALSSSTTRIFHTSWSEDALAALQIARDLGAEISQEGGVMTITPNALPVCDTWSAGESGLSLRMYSAIAASLDRVIVIDGHGSLKGRPTEFITEVLSTMGAKVTGEGLPLTIQGPMLPGEYGVNGSFSSQLLTGLLIALPLLKGDTELIVINLTSTPYIDMTMEMMRLFGVVVSHHDYRVFKIRGGQKYIGTDLSIEADWSGLAFILVAGAITAGTADSARTGVHADLVNPLDVTKQGELIIRGVQKNSFQADLAIVEVLQMAGCVISFKEGDALERVVNVSNHECGNSGLTAFSFDATHCPDLIPPLCILATQCTGESRISGVDRLQHKESDRGIMLRNELGKLGANINIEGDVMIIEGKQSLHGAEVDACGDHRIAMTLVCAGLVAKGDTTINGAECVSKSYPGFYRDIRVLNGIILGDKALFISRDV